MRVQEILTLQGTGGLLILQGDCEQEILLNIEASQTRNQTESTFAGV